jgi:hypothetical protein
MKTVFLVFMGLMFIICLAGCDEKEENDYFTLNDVVFDVNNTSEIPSPMSAIDLYYISKNNYFSIYECKKNKESKIIAGYLDIKTIEVLDEMSQTLVSSLSNDYYVSGIDNYLKKYQDAVISGKINENENPIECKYVSIEQLLLIDGNRRLIFVLEEKSINAENIKTNENIEFKLYTNVEGYILSGIFYTKECEPNRNSFTHFLFADTSVKKYYTENEIQFQFLNIYDNKYIEEYTNEILDYPNNEDYYQQIKGIIVSEEKKLIENITFKYDYIEIIKILKGE